MLELDSLSPTTLVGAIVSPLTVLMPSTTSESFNNNASANNSTQVNPILGLILLLSIIFILFGTFFYALYLAVKCNKGIFAVLAFIFAFMFPWFYIFIALVFQKCNCN